MPLSKGCSKKARSANIREMKRAGHPTKQAAAAAYSTQRRQGCSVPRKGKRKVKP